MGACAHDRWDHAMAKDSDAHRRGVITGLFRERVSRRFQAPGACGDARYGDAVERYASDDSEQAVSDRLADGRKSAVGELVT